ncbi:aspartate dehydrogenase [Enterovirga sp.]|uniref:aspartate dehydrogenase n=1 Tax=Enterovirga sp. TaxID=2026350 RepID=UPI00261C6567|nr:aspartate dehydrogenase [Enterovirga sp.]MDB5592440.1 L-Aspartate dehydrogenase [Enterovirga sp.]
MSANIAGQDSGAKTVAIGGFGAIGQKLARALDDGLPGLRLAAVSARNTERAAAVVAGFRSPVPVVPLAELGRHADIVVECAPAEVFRELAVPALEAGRTLVVISVGALLTHTDVEDLARRHNGRIVVPSGALLGLDAVRAAAEGEIRRVTMVTRKPPAGLKGAPYLVRNNIDVSALSEPLKVFDGTAREAVVGFPANVNVAAALSLAGIGPDRTTIEIWAVPGLDRNRHTITVESDSADFTMSIANIPSDENPKTGRITALSILAALRRLTSPVQIGT